jgi:hypothetical protein
MNKVAILSVLFAVTLSLKVANLPCCPETYIFDEDTLLCVCPLNTPYISNAGRCIACLAPATWDNNTKTCQKCRNDQTEDAVGNCLCSDKTTPFDNGRICTVCPDGLPIWNGHKCVACPPNTEYDVKSKTCTVCPPGLAYSKTDRTCEIAQK